MLIKRCWKRRDCGGQRLVDLSSLVTTGPKQHVNGQAFDLCPPAADAPNFDGLRRRLIEEEVLLVFSIYASHKLVILSRPIDRQSSKRR
jgi:hypothetical protein